MTSPFAVQLRKDEDRRIRAGHLWIYSNEIDVKATPLAGIEPGEIVDVRDARGAWLGRGYVNPHSLIAIRLLTRRRQEQIDAAFVRGRVERALELRQQLFDRPFYRLIFGEADGLPGIVADRFGDVVVVQPTTAGAERLLDPIVDALVEVVGATGVLVRADSSTRSYEGLPEYTRVASGEVPEVVRIEENGARFDVPILTGQKTGWFFDHRMSRGRLAAYASGARVLDVFSYLGGWGIQAAVAGARAVHCVDASAPALNGVEVNADLNGVADRVSVERGDAFAVLQRLRDAGESFDVVVVDPPAFIKRRKDQREGEMAYRRLNRAALELLGPDGLLVSASCSFHMERDALLRAILWGAEGSGRDVQVLEEGHQAPDHPFHPAIPETNYLKTFFVRVLNTRQ